MAVGSPAAMVRLTSSRMRRSPRTTLAFSMCSSGGMEVSAASVIVIFDGVNLIVVQAQVVADLVDQDVGDDLGQADVAALAPFVEDRTAIEEDAPRLRRLTHGAACADLDRGIEARQFERALAPHIGHSLRDRGVGDADG